MPFSLGQEKTNPPPKGFLTGRVTSEKGEPLAGVKVEWEAARDDTTNADGFYYLHDQFGATIDDNILLQD